VEVLKQLEAQRSRLELDPVATDALATLLGQGGTSSTDEIAWAFRKLYRGQESCPAHPFHASMLPLWEREETISAPLP